jgi:pyrophosphatase PpaX
MRALAFLRSLSEVRGGAPRRHPRADYDPDVKAFVFDWDGTLVDTLGQIFHANRAVLGRLGLPFDEALYRQHYNPDWRLMYERLGVPIDKLEEAGERWLEAFDPDHFGEAFPGSVDALRRLRSAGHPLGLVTAGDRSIVTRQLQRSGLDEVLGVRVFGDDLPVHKPDPRPLRLALSELGIRDAADAAYVGDAPDDMRMARAVGADAVGITSIVGRPDELVPAGASSVHASVAAWVDVLLGAATGETLTDRASR